VTNTVTRAPKIIFFIEWSPGVAQASRVPATRLERFSVAKLTGAASKLLACRCPHR